MVNHFSVFQTWIKITSLFPFFSLFLHCGPRYIPATQTTISGYLFRLSHSMQMKHRGPGNSKGHFDPTWWNTFDGTRLYVNIEHSNNGESTGPNWHLQFWCYQIYGSSFITPMRHFFYKHTVFNSTALNKKTFVFTNLGLICYNLRYILGCCIHLSIHRSSLTGLLINYRDILIFPDNDRNSFHRFIFKRKEKIENMCKLYITTKTGLNIILNNKLEVSNVKSNIIIHS